MSIIQTRNGMEALDLARAHHPDLILMDIQLPEVSGLVVTKWLKEDDDLQSIPGDRRHRFRHEGRRGADPAGRLRGLHLQTHLGASLFGNDCPLHWTCQLSVQACFRFEYLRGWSLTARVLIVDDIPTNVRLLEARLTAEYFDVSTASSGRRGARDLRRAATSTSCCST